MFKRKVKGILVLLTIAVLAVATVVLAIIEVVNTRTISGLTLIPVLAGMVIFGVPSMVKDYKELKEIYEAADDE